MNRKLALLAAAMKAYDAVFTLERCDVCGAEWDRQEGEQCRWCAARRQADHDHILRPPAPRGYGYADKGMRCIACDRWWSGSEDTTCRRCKGPTEPYDDLKRFGINPELDRQHDLKRWAHDLDLAVDAELITQAEGEAAWASATKHQTASHSSTGTTSTTTSTTTTTPSSKNSPTAADGPPSPPKRNKANRRSSSPWPWTPPNEATQ